MSSTSVPPAGSPWLRLGRGIRRSRGTRGPGREGRVLRARRKGTVECVPAMKQRAVLQIFVAARRGPPLHTFPYVIP